MLEVYDRDLYDYDINDVAAVLERGWHELARFAEKMRWRSCCDFGNSSLPPCVRVWQGFITAFNGSLNHGLLLGYRLNDLFALAATPNNRIYEYQKSLDYWPLARTAKSQELDRATELEVSKIMKRITKAFASGETIGDAFMKISTRKQLSQFSRRHDETIMKDFLELRIATSTAEVFKWLNYGLASSAACDEAWWRCTLCDVKSIVQDLLEVKRRIDTDVPISPDHHLLLNMLIFNAHPQLSFFPDAEGRQVFKMTLIEPRRGYTRRGQVTDMTEVILAEPAFQLAWDLQRRSTKPRFARKCRFPKCGKLFYTGRKNAKSCPGSQRDKKSECALGWVRYKRYMVKVGKNPEKDWNNKQLQEEFISYDNS